MTRRTNSSKRGFSKRWRSFLHYSTISMYLPHIFFAVSCLVIQGCCGFSQQGFLFSSSQSHNVRLVSTSIISNNRCTSTTLQMSHKENRSWEDEFLEEIRRRNLDDDAIQKPYRSDRIPWTFRLKKHIQFLRNQMQQQRYFPKITLQKLLVYVNIAFFAYQVATVPAAATVQTAKTALPNVFLSPLTTDFMFMGYFARLQPHRCITSGFLHGGVLHLLLNMQALWTTPAWLEAGLGPSLYITVYLFSVVAANLCHATFLGYNVPCIGASGGICGLMGYRFVMLRKMKQNAYSNAIFKSMVQLILYGALIPRVSNAAHIGGFVAGALLGWILGPNFSKSYAAKRRRWLVRDPSTSPTLQNVMGSDLVNNPSRISLKLFWIGVLLFCANDPTLRQIPLLVSRGIIDPGSLGGRLILR